MPALSCLNGHATAPGQTFCPVCGEQLTARCPGGHQLSPDDQFCRHCGASALEAIAEPVAGPAISGRAVGAHPAGSGWANAAANSSSSPGPVVPGPGLAAHPAGSARANAAGNSSETTQIPVAGSVPLLGPGPTGTGSVDPWSHSHPESGVPAGRWWTGRVVLAVGVALVAMVVVAAVGTLLLAGRHRTTSIQAGLAAATKPGRVAAAPTTSPPPSTTATTVTATTVPAPPVITVAPLPPSPPVLAGQTGVATIASLVAQSAAVRPSVQGAINDVLDCDELVVSGQSTLQQAIDTRERLSQSLAGINIAGVPYGPQLINDLANAFNDSTTADQDYQNWMSDFADYDYPCHSDPTQDDAYNQGQAASTQATQDKALFVGLWNLIAGTYGQRTYSVNDI